MSIFPAPAVPLGLFRPRHKVRGSLPSQLVYFPNLTLDELVFGGQKTNNSSFGGQEWWDLRQQGVMCHRHLAWGLGFYCLTILGIRKQNLVGPGFLLRSS